MIEIGAPNIAESAEKFNKLMARTCFTPSKSVTFIYVGKRNTLQLKGPLMRSVSLENESWLKVLGESLGRGHDRRRAIAAAHSIRSRYPTPDSVSIGDFVVLVCSLRRS